MRAVITPARAKGEVYAPPSKSVAHRLLIGAGLSDGVSVIHGISECDDAIATMNCLRSLGVRFDINGSNVTVYGKAPKDMIPTKELRCRESGSTIRFLIPIAFLLGAEVKLSGATSLLKRPMTPYVEIAKKYGFKFDMTATDITLCGNLESGIYELDGNISSQFISGLLFALPLCSGNSTIKISKPIESLSYIRLTLEAIGYFGIKAEFDEESGTIRIPGNQRYTPTEVNNEGDYSGAAFTDSLNYLGGEVKVLGIRENSKQGDSVYKEYFKLISEGTPRLDISDCPDLAPILFALAAAKHGASFIGTKRLKIKESDRTEAMRCELAKLGVKLTVYENEVEIKGGISAPKEPIYGHNDHRIVMAMAVLLSLLGGEIIGAEAISKSYPEFFSDIRSLGITVKEYEA